MIFTKKRSNITIITAENPTENHPVPKVGDKIYAYDDGKIRISREFQVEVIAIKKMWQLPRKVRRAWKSDVKECYWLFAPKTDYVIVTKVVGAEDNSFSFFVRTHGGRWFSISHDGNDYDYWGGALLDVTGKHWASLHEQGL